MYVFFMSTSWCQYTLYWQTMCRCESQSSTRTDSHQNTVIKGYKTVLNCTVLNFLVIKEKEEKLNRCVYVHIVTSLSSPILQVACYGVTINRTQQGRGHICSVGLKWWGYAGVGAAAAQSQISLSPALCHTSICSSLSLFLPGSVLHSARIKIVSSICHIPGSAPAVSNDPVSPCSVTLRQ